MTSRSLSVFIFGFWQNIKRLLTLRFHRKLNFKLPCFVFFLKMWSQLTENAENEDVNEDTITPLVLNPLVAIVGSHVVKQVHLIQHIQNTHTKHKINKIKKTIVWKKVQLYMPEIALLPPQNGKRIRFKRKHHGWPIW